MVRLFLEDEPRIDIVDEVKVWNMKLLTKYCFRIKSAPRNI